MQIEGCWMAEMSTLVRSLKATKARQQDTGVPEKYQVVLSAD